MKEEFGMESMYVYPAKISDKKGEVEITFVDFPEIYVCASNVKQAIEVAQEELAMTLISYLDEGKIVPEPSVFEKESSYIQVWLPYYKGKIKQVFVKKTLTIPQWLNILAMERNLNCSAILVSGIKKELGLDK